MKEFKEIRKLEDELNLLLNKLCDDKLYRGNDRHNTLIINLLEEIMEDKEGLISNYIYEEQDKNIPENIKFNKLELLYKSLLETEK